LTELCGVAVPGNWALERGSHDASGQAQCLRPTQVLPALQAVLEKVIVELMIGVALLGEKAKY